MSTNSPSLGCPLLLGVACLLFPHTVLADTSRFYDDGLSFPLVSYETPMISAFRSERPVYQVADTARFYDDGLTQPSMAKYGSEIGSSNSSVFQIADTARFYDDGLTVAYVEPQMMPIQYVEVTSMNDGIGIYQIGFAQAILDNPFEF